MNKVFKLSLLLTALTSAGLCFADACDDMKAEVNNLTKSSTNLNASISKIESKALNGDNCAKNIIGRLFYEGKIVGKDRARAKAIFADLTNLGYAPSSFNLAFAISEEDNPNLELISNLLVGIYSKFITDKENSAIASKARDFGYDFFASMNSETGRNAKLQFEESIKFANLDGGATLRRQSAEMKQKEEAVVSILMMGMAIKGASNILKAQQAARSSPTIFINSGPSFTSYYAYPMSGNMLYLVPRF